MASRFPWVLEEETLKINEKERNKIWCFVGLLLTVSSYSINSFPLFLMISLVLAREIDCGRLVVKLVFVFDFLK